MKRIVIVCMLMICALATMSQTYVSKISLPNKATVFSKAFPIGTEVRLVDSAKTWTLTHAVTASQTMTTVFTNGWGASQAIATVSGLQAALDAKINVADSNKTSANNYVTMKRVADTYAVKASPQFSGSGYTSGTFAIAGNAYFDSSLYYGSAAGNAWMRFAVPQVGTPRYRLDLENLGDVSIQAKSGIGQVKIIQRDTAPTIAVANLINIGTVRLENKTSTPTPAESMIYYNATTHTWMGYNGTAWIDLASGSNTNFQGLAWNEVTDTYVRQGTLVGQTLGVTPGDLLLPVQSKIKGCVLNINGTVNYYLSATDWAYKASGAASNLTGADGQVMVEIPKFYIQYQKNGNYHIWNVSIDSLAGYTRHPAFIKDGAYVNYRYIGAYEAVLWDATTDSTYRDYRAGVTIDPANDKLTSVSGKRPVTNFTRASGRAMAARLGSGWRQQDYDLCNAIEWLILIEYGTFYIQNIAEVGPGITNVGDWAAYNNYYPFALTGNGNTIGNASGDNAGGVTCAADATKYSKYRGISNFYGHIYKFVDGLNINDNHPYVTNNSAVWADNTSTGYTDLGITLAAADGWQKTLTPSSRLMLPASVGGGSTTYVTDYYYQAAGWRVAFLGGRASDGATAGPWHWNLNRDSGSSASVVGSRVAF